MIKWNISLAMTGAWFKKPLCDVEHGAILLPFAPRDWKFTHCIDVIKEVAANWKKLLDTFKQIKAAEAIAKDKR